MKNVHINLSLYLTHCYHLLCVLELATKMLHKLLLQKISKQTNTEEKVSKTEFEILILGESSTKFGNLIVEGAKPLHIIKTAAKKGSCESYKTAWWQQ